MFTFADDEPIKSSKDDLLGREHFVSQMSSTILELKNNNGVCIGINGKWGSGKTSIINMIVSEIEEHSDENIVLKFEPWNYSSEKQLVDQFFILLANGLAETKKQSFLKASNLLLDYLDTIEDTSLKGTTAAFVGRHIVSGLSNGTILGTKDLSAKKAKAIELLRDQDSKIIIVIDDIDRLPNEQIRLIFQMVSSFAKFPNIIYLLSFDIDIVANALEEVQKCSGYDYLEKIVQMQIGIPEIRQSNIGKILFHFLDEITQQYSLTIDDKYWNEMYYGYAEEGIKTIRDINRLANAISAKCMIIGSEVNFVDLFMITFIEHKHPKLYNWIKNNRYILLGLISYRYIFDKKKSECKDFVINELAIIDKDKDQGQGQYYYDILIKLFPALAKATKEAYTYDEMALYRKRRIGHESCFDRYFCFDLETGDIPNAVLSTILYKSNRDELFKIINELNKRNSITYLLDEIRANMTELTVDRITLIIDVLIQLAATFSGEKSTSFVPLQNRDYAELVVEQLMAKIDDSERNYEIIRDALIASDEKSIQTLARLINTIERSYGRFNSNDLNAEKQFISKEQLADCELLYCEAFRKNEGASDVLGYTNALIVLYLYKCLDSQGYNEFLQKVLKDDIGKLRFIQMYAGNIYDTDGKAWGFSKEYSEEISTDEVIAAFNRCVENNTIWKLPKDVLRKVIAFEIWSHGSMDADDKVTEDEIDARIIELRGE